MAYTDSILTKAGYFTFVQAAKFLGLPYWALYQRVQKNQLPKPTTEVKGYRRLYYTLEDLSRMKEMI